VSGKSGSSGVVVPPRASRHADSHSPAGDLSPAGGTETAAVAQARPHADGERRAATHELEVDVEENGSSNAGCKRVGPASGMTMDLPDDEHGIRHREQPRLPMHSDLDGSRRIDEGPPAEQRPQQQQQQQQHEMGPITEEEVRVELREMSCCHVWVSVRPLCGLSVSVHRV
jgi:hypothetical protein